MRTQLQEAFAQYGKVKGVRLPTDRDTGELKGIGFVEFADQDGKASILARAEFEMLFDL